MKKSELEQEIRNLRSALACERAAHDATERRAQRWQEVVTNTEKRVLGEISRWLEEHP